MRDTMVNLVVWSAHHTVSAKVDFAVYASNFGVCRYGAKFNAYKPLLN